MKAKLAKAVLFTSIFLAASAALADWCLIVHPVPATTKLCRKAMELGATPGQVAGCYGQAWPTPKKQQACLQSLIDSLK